MTINNRIIGLKQQIRDASCVLAEIPQDILVAKTSIEGYGTIGEQFRHFINYIEVLLRDYNTGSIDFTNRDRDPLLEKDKSFLNKRMSFLLDQVDALSSQNENSLVTSVFTPVAGQESVLDKASLGFLINYVSDHTYHHISMIKVLAKLHGVDVHFAAGVAPSTQVHEAAKVAL